MEHTPGPWIDHDGQIYPEKTGKTIAIIPYYDKENQTHSANARLIAAAPDMLEMLKTIDSLMASRFWMTSKKSSINWQKVRDEIQRTIQNAKK